MNKRRIFALALLSLVLTIIGFIVVDEIRLRRPAYGMSREQVRDFLGTPSEIVSRAEVAQYPTPCNKDAIVDAYLYRRKVRESLYVYFNSVDRVECTERAMSFSIVTR